MKNYDFELANKYDFYANYYMHYAIGTRYEDLIEITKTSYISLLKKLNNSKKAMIKIFATNTIVGFQQNSKTYILQEVNQDVFNCLLLSQIHEHHRRKNESRRHLDDYYIPEDLENIPTDINVEDKILDKIEKQELKIFLDSILLKKQSRRFFKNKIEGMSLTEIAKEENRDVSAIKRSVDSAIEKSFKKILEKYQNFIWEVTLYIERR